MALRKREGALTSKEKRIVKGLLNKGWRNQDIQALLNIGRDATVNSARVTEVKNNDQQRPASDDEIAFFEIRKDSYDQQTGLNKVDDERLIRAREAMILAVQIYNSSALNFKSEVFAVLANIAWTYLLHEFYDRKVIPITQSSGRSLLLSQMVKMEASPLSDGMKNNLSSIMTIRDEVEHKLLGKGDLKWQGLFQACCLNFDNVLCAQFGEKLTLSKDLSFALQFQKMNVDQLATLNKYEIPQHIESIDARISQVLSPEQLSDLEYQFRVIYTLDSASKSRAHFEFVRPDSDEGKEIRNILVQYKTADHLYPYKPKQVCALVHELTKKPFSIHHHTQAWRLLEVRPGTDAKQPENTNKEYCIYHSAHGDYTYSDKWVERLIEYVGAAVPSMSMQGTGPLPSE